MFAPLFLYDPGLPVLRNSQGKVAELRLELQSVGGKKDKGHLGKKIALKKIVANMTMSNNDMIALFPDVIQVMGLASLEIKKMCFLYLVHYARIKPEIALKALPHLVQVRRISTLSKF
jgi:AP-2 complex subunit beta-1